MSFPLTGNAKIKKALENAMRERRLPHALLIDGDIGTGRHTLAKYLSRAAVCSGDVVPCENCNQCRVAKGGNHPDITVVSLEEGKKNISVAQIRQLRNEAYIKPHQATCRVFIIDAADTMNEQSQNALLKVLEEPPGNAVFILIAQNKASLLDTVISRCVVLTLHAHSFEEALEYISSYTQKERDVIIDTLKNTRNNIGKALILLNESSNAKISANAEEFLEYMKRGDEWGMLKALAELEKSRPKTEQFFGDLKYALAQEIKKSPKSHRAATFSKFYEKLCLLQENLITNINLSLLFATLTAQAKSCISEKQ